MRIDNDTIVLVLMNDQGQYFPKWYDRLGDFATGDPPDVVDKLLKDLETDGHAEYCPHRADRTFELTVITPDNARIDPAWEVDGEDRSYWSRCCTSRDLFDRLRAMGVPPGRF